ncbi:hypothetical protein DJ021_13250 [Phenylobacterium hankyongense]|uniref:Uncharacterized protein n=1 Tax=Phenylobacterium hankyongense TaxID=1813876 RepID=A0A328B2F7_9CAUL|nr:hypothetical protein [Phenylobacterium hankyongense]RAK60705.1 hypothetical protein DJ021_13250 [Phenylobacterium hankyongense]
MRQTLLLAIAILAAASSACSASAAPKPAQTAVPAVPDPCADPAPSRVADPLTMPRFGCANAINLRLMVADPRDLERGAPLADPSGDGALAAAQRHRLGQVKPLGAAAASGSGPGAATEAR